MNTHEHEQQALQAQAELAERQKLPAGGNPAVDRYRLVMRALKRAPTEQLPANFAAQVAARLVIPEDKATLEDWLVTGLLLAMAITGLIYMRPIVAEVLAQFHFSVPELPWRLLVAGAVAVGLAWAVDRGILDWRERGHFR